MDTALSLETFKFPLKHFYTISHSAVDQSASEIRRHRRRHMMRYELFIIFIIVVM